MIRGFAAMALAFASAASAEIIGNADIVALHQAGVGDQVILAKIKMSAATFDMSTAQIIALKQKGISAAVLTAMIAMPTAVPPGEGPVATAAPFATDGALPPAPGIYLIDESNGAQRLVRIDATGANQAKSGGVLGYALTGGLASMSVKAVIPGGTARTHATGAQPAFLFRVDQSGTNIFAGPLGTSVTPNDFSLVRLTAKGERRETRVGSMNIGGVKTGVMDRDRIAFAYDEISPGVFRVTPTAPLSSGEYGFLYQPASAAGFGGGSAGATGARVFDFSVGLK